jgi:alkylated DNA nucleotide flippase Atl1
MGAEQAPKRGRPTDFEQTLADAICARMQAGESLRAICKPDDMPAESTVRTWAVANHQGFHAQYTRAREAQMDALAEDLIEIADEKDADTQRARLRVDTRKWLMSKIAPKRFGDRTHHELTGRDGGPIKTQDLSRLTDEQLSALNAILGTVADAGGSEGGDPPQGD